MSHIPTPSVRPQSGLRKEASAGQDWATVADAFWSLFELVGASSDALVTEAHRIRFEVYCRDRRWEPENDGNPGLECDSYDERARHVLLRYRPENRFVGTMRSVEPDAVSPEKSFPVQELVDDPRLHQRARVAGMVEASRFCLSRGRMADLSPGGEEAAALRMVNPFLMIGLMVAVIQTPLELGYADVCAVLEPWLAHRLMRFGFAMELIGAPVEHHGLRQPCLIPVAGNVDRPIVAENAFLQFFARRQPLWRPSDWSVAA